MSLEVTWLGHATVALRLGGALVLTDPLLGESNGVLRRAAPAPDPERWREPDAVLVSHLHHDHAELPSLRRLPGATVLSAEDNATWLRRRAGIPTAAALRDHVPHELADTDVRVVQVRADHGHRPMPHRPNAAHGHLLLSGDTRVWFAGDTSLYDEMADLPDLAGGEIDLALVPVGGWAPRLSGGHMGPVDAARACARVGARVAVPIHWGTLHLPGMRARPPGWMDRPGPDFARALAREAPGCRPVLLGVGESQDLSRHDPEEQP